MAARAAQEYIAAALFAMLTACGAKAETDRMSDTQLGALGREWVEIREEGGGNRLVLRPLDADIPPMRGGRRRLSLTAGGGSESFASGAADAMESIGTGGWNLQGGMLQLEIEGWSGSYRIEELSDDVLILERQ
jgi:hypothetical protein